VADVVIGVDKGQRAVGEGAGVLDGDEDAVGKPARRQVAPREIEVLATAGEERGNGSNSDRERQQAQQTSLIQTKPSSFPFRTNLLELKV
jgi:hypothetical protein